MTKAIAFSKSELGAIKCKLNLLAVVIMIESENAENCANDIAQVDTQILQDLDVDGDQIPQPIRQILKYSRSILARFLAKPRVITGEQNGTGLVAPDLNRQKADINCRGPNIVAYSDLEQSSVN